MLKISPNLKFHRNYNASEITVRCGEWNIANITNDTSLKPQSIEAETVIIHPEFDKEINYNDLAIIILKDSFDMTAGHIRPICLPTKNGSDIDMNNCFAFGWGRDRFGRKGEYATTLKHVKLNILTSIQHHGSPKIQPVRRPAFAKFF